MNAEPSSADVMLHPDQEPGARRPWLRMTGYVAALVLLAAAVYIAVTQTDWSGLKQARPGQIAALLGLVAAGLVLNGLLFRIITRPFEAHRPVSVGEWIAMISASALLNYLPMRAGLLGRLAYLKKVRGIGYRANVATLIATSFATTALYALVAAATLWRGKFDLMWFIVMDAGLIVLTLVTWPMMRWLIRRYGAPTGSLGMDAIFVWYLLRLADTLCFGGRFYLAAAVFGTALDFQFALVLAVACNFATLATPLPGGFGLREWLGGWLASWRGNTNMSIAQGMSVLVVDRAAEVIVFMVMGVWGLVYLHRRQKMTNVEFQMTNE